MTTQTAKPGGEGCSMVDQDESAYRIAFAVVKHFPCGGMQRNTLRMARAHTSGFTSLRYTRAAAAERSATPWAGASTDEPTPQDIVQA
jgi:hypothetical protein